MYLVMIAWLYVALMMAVAEATHVNGTVLGALITFLLYGVGPLALALYLLGTPARRRARIEAEARESAERAAAGAAAPSSLPALPALQAVQDAGAVAETAPLPRSGTGALDPDGGRHAAGLAEDGLVTPVRKEA